MISFLRGTVDTVQDGAAVIDVGGVGYEVRVASDTAQRLASCGKDEEVRVYTYTYLREDQIALYGFWFREDLELFRMLITVSGIGPKGGLALLSVGSADDLRFAIMSGDARMIARAPGVGKKTAERVILELRDKVAGMYSAAMAEREDADALTGSDTDFPDSYAGSSGDAAGREGEPASEAAQALMALGYSRAEASGAVRSVMKSAGKNSGSMDTESILKAALGYL